MPGFAGLFDCGWRSLHLASIAALRVGQPSYVGF
jgi:hypothetical protein